MLKKIVLGLLLTSSLFAETELWKFFKYSTAYASFSLNAPRHQDDRFAIIGGLSTGDLMVERTERDLEADFQKSFGLRKIGRFKYEPKRGVKNAGVGGTWYDGSEQSANENATLGPVKGWEYLIKFSQGRQWGNEYLNQEYWLRYIGDWAMIKVGWTDLGLEEITYGQGDVRLKKEVNDRVNLSIGFKHRQHPVYGFDAMILDTTWYRGQWWAFAEDAFGIDDNMWYDPTMVDENGKIFAYTDREYFIYHFPGMLETYIDDLKKDLGYQRETSLVFGLDYYHYSDNWWVHAWGNFLPYHYGHDKYSYHNAHQYSQHLDNNNPAHTFEFSEPMWRGWEDYDVGAILGVKLQDNLGVFAEGKYLYYWERPAYDFKFGLNYQFVGF
jgi:hypothetical protein